MSIGFDPSQIETLIADVNAVESCVNTAMDEVDALMKQLTSDTVFGECEYKDELVDLQKKLNTAKETIANILSTVSKKVEVVGQKAGVSVSKNMMSVQDQAALIQAAMNKVN